MAGKVLNKASALNRVESWLRRNELVGDRMREGRLFPTVTGPDTDGDWNLRVYFVVPGWGEFVVRPSHMIDPFNDGGFAPDEDRVSDKGDEVYWTINVEVKYTKQQLVVAIDEFATLSDAVLYLENVYS